jgi:hypothetical protein
VWWWWKWEEEVVWWRGGGGWEEVVEVGVPLCVEEGVLELLAVQGLVVLLVLVVLVVHHQFLAHQ